MREAAMKRERKERERMGVEEGDENAATPASRLPMPRSASPSIRNYWGN